MISSILAKTNFGDLQGIVAKLQQGGLIEQVKYGSATGQTCRLQPTSCGLLSAISKFRSWLANSGFRWMLH